MSRAQTLAKPRPQSRNKLGTKASSKKGPFLSGKTLIALLCILLAAATIALYSPVIGHSFIVTDDHDYVTANPHIHNGLTWSTIRWAFTSTDAANWHPLTWLSHALDYQLFGLSPAGHHLDSVLIHSLNAALLFLLLVWVTKRVGPSLLVAALFALHPINVESVAWVAERKNVLSTLFFFLAIGAYVRYAQKPDWRRYLLVAALFSLGLMAKPMVITLPFVLLLLDYWPLDRVSIDGAPSDPSTLNGTPRQSVSRLLLEKVPLLFLSAASAWITVKAQRSAVRTFGEFPLSVRIENAAASYGLYLWKMLWPAHLAFYNHTAIVLPAWQWILSTLVVVAITALVVIYRRRRYLPVGWFWFLGTLVPVIGLVQVGDAPMADRYAYVPLIGIFVMIAFGLADLAAAKGIGRMWQLAPALCVFVALGFVTFRQMSYWDSDYHLWSHSLAVENNPYAHEALAAGLTSQDAATEAKNQDGFTTEQQRTDEARQHLEEALKIRRVQAQQNPDAYLPYLATTLNNLGHLDFRQKRMDEARQHFEEALKIRRALTQKNPDTYRLGLATTLNNLGNVDQLQSQPDEARQHYEEALKIYDQPTQQDPNLYLPGMALVLTDLGSLDFRQKRMDEAREHFEASLKINRQLAQHDPDTYLPNVATTLNILGFVDGGQNKTEEARAYYQEALTILRKLAQSDHRYGREVARVETNLQQLGNGASSQ